MYKVIKTFYSSNTLYRIGQQIEESAETPLWLKKGFLMEIKVPKPAETKPAPEVETKEDAPKAKSKTKKG